jgi:muramoyltetrapeptide carboxypeptidase
MDRSWRSLAPGEPIGVVALSGPVDPERLEAGIEVLRSWGHPLVLARNLGSRAGYLAGSDEERIDGLFELIERGTRTFIAARGGYGVTRLLDRLRLSELARDGVRFVGFSDLTGLMNPLAARGVPQLHGPMVAAGLHRSRNSKRLRAALSGDLVGERLFRVPERKVVRPGRAEGLAFGGNLALLAALVGTEHEPRYDGSVLFIEEVDEPIYRLDRMLTHLSSSGRLRRVKALICGSLRGCGPVEQRTTRWRKLVAELAPSNAVVVTDMPFGHAASNLAFPIGARVKIDTRAGEITWSS